MRRIGLRAYLLSSFLLLGLLIAAMTGVVWLSSNELKSSAITMNAAVESITVAQSILDRLEANRRRTLLEKQHDRTVIFNDLEEGLAQIESYIDSPDERALVNSVRAHIDIFLTQYDKLQRRGIAGRQLYLATAPSFDRSVSEISRLIQLNQEQARAQESEARVASEKYKRLALGLWVVVLTSVGLLFLMFHTLVSIPIRRLQRAIEAFSESRSPPPTPQRSLTEISIIAAKFYELALKLKRQSEQRLTFLAAVAHDLKNPLAAIQTSMELLSSPEVGAVGESQIKMILSRQVQQLLRLVDDLLDATRIESGKIDLQIRTEDLSVLVGDCVTLFSSLSPLHEISYRKPNEPVIVQCDSARIGQVINNLLSNAIKYSPEGGAIEVAVKATGDFAIVAVRDPGIGIDSWQIDGIFEPFRRPSSDEHRISGVGLGLSTSKKIVEAHKGWIKVQSRKGKGTIFFVTIPLVDRSQAQGALVDPSNEFEKEWLNHLQPN